MDSGRRPLTPVSQEGGRKIGAWWEAVEKTQGPAHEGGGVREMGSPLERLFENLIKLM